MAANESHEGLSGWLRSALWAELGRRNDRAAFERRLSSAGSDEAGGASFANDQALFAFIRGRSESLEDFDDSVDAVIEDIGTLAAKTSSGHWRSKAVSELFRKLARMDYGAAWDLVQEPCLNEQLRAEVPGLFNSNQTAATTGFFRALSSEKLVMTYLGEWERVLELPEVKKNYESYQAQLNSRLSGDIAIPPEEVIRETPSASHQTQILQSVIWSAGSDHVNDFFPTPEGPNRLPNFQQRYDFLIEGIEQGTFPEKQKESLLKSLENEFKGKLGAE
ncbi:MAG: hypothetical protein QNL33_06525 [Akkermansiaceae bacterium]